MQCFYELLSLSICQNTQLLIAFPIFKQRLLCNPDHERRLQLYDLIRYITGKYFVALSVVLFVLATSRLYKVNFVRCPPASCSQLEKNSCRLPVKLPLSYFVKIGERSVSDHHVNLLCQVASSDPSEGSPVHAEFTLDPYNCFQVL